MSVKKDGRFFYYVNAILCEYPLSFHTDSLPNEYVDVRVSGDNKYFNVVYHRYDYGKREDIHMTIKKTKRSVRLSFASLLTRELVTASDKIGRQYYILMTRDHKDLAFRIRRQIKASLHIKH